MGLLKDMLEFEVVGEAGDGQEALELIQKSQPDVALIDVNMPRMDGLQTVRRFAAKIERTGSHADDLSKR